jgi:hypothetical protein
MPESCLIFVAAFRRLVVHFGVCDDHSLVFIKGVKLLSSADQ